MASLLNEEEQQIAQSDKEFYATTYGGFSETADDRDFKYTKAEDVEDEVSHVVNAWSSHVTFLT